eukprot:CAMPEP_0176485522 /NCGR_PEP_ID=MMETSP0200_2-20121128/5082_1 /TAXON_ID=947934 /ORGANISM="Chaetoceros sp., Strain GSL56" /LENGTH=793 /DNA_ID=CAMNT_0017882167 /DNA_START=214 /DNA_END=2595 /DNA_ORIENTATION=-
MTRTIKKTNSGTTTTSTVIATETTTTTRTNNNDEVNDIHLRLLCLDYLRSLRRNQHHSHPYSNDNTTNNKNKSRQQNDQDYLTLAIWSLNKSLSYSLDDDRRHPFLKKEDDQQQQQQQAHQGQVTDACFPSNSSPLTTYSTTTTTTTTKQDLTLHKQSQNGVPWTRNISIPALSVMEGEILHPNTTKSSSSSSSSVPILDQLDEIYPYNDMHPSNYYRLYKHNGLNNIPLTLPYLVQCALTRTSPLIKGGIMSREKGYKLLQQNKLFQKFQEAVKAKGFFHISEQDIVARSNHGGGHEKVVEEQGRGQGKGSGGRRTNRLTKIRKEYIRKEILEERRQQVVEKFRQKLLENGMMEEWDDDPGGISVGERQGITSDEEEEATVAASVMGDGAGRRSSREVYKNHQKGEQLQKEKEDHEEKAGEIYFSDDSSLHVKMKRRLTSSQSKRMSMMGNPTREDLQEAETLKVRGNAYMQQKKYNQARDFYTKALELSPMGPTSHVYYSNRAAALLSMRNFTEAVWDAERSIQLKPEYPKAHARLGLARFLLGQYQEAVESYTRAVELEPTNETSISYLEKSKRKVATALASTRSVVAVDEEHEYDDFDDVSLSSKRTTISQRAKDTVARANSRKSSIHTSKSFPMSQEYLSHQGESSFDTASLSENKLEEANRLKIEGNKAMARRDYSQAIQNYSKALRLAPAGPQSHVFFANRAAAFCYLERYEEAELDAERALALEPEFAKAHARLGLSRYFLKDFQGAVEAYESASMYDPENESNRIYLAKSKLKLEREQSTSARE